MLRDKRQGTRGAIMGLQKLKSYKNIGIANAFIISGAAIGALGLLAFLVPPVYRMVREEVS